MLTLDIVSHCWRYSRVLAYQLASLEKHPPTRVLVTPIVFYSPDDQPTVDVLCRFGAFDTALPLPLPELLQRAIGRNMAAIRTEADVVWMADCDYYFGPGCLDTLAALDLTTSPLFYPREVLINKTHAIGDEYARRAHDGLEVDPADFQSLRMRKAIGGIQIVPGDVARAVGYCPASKYQNPTNRTRFRFSSDIAFRRAVGRSTPIDLPNLYRIRQTTEGVVDTLA